MFDFEMYRQHLNVLDTLDQGFPQGGESSPGDEFILNILELQMKKKKRSKPYTSVNLKLIIDILELQKNK